MANYVKVNGVYVKDYEHITGNDGRDYLIKIIFTKDPKEAKEVPNTLIARLLMSVRKALRINDDSGNYLYTIDSLNDKHLSDIIANKAVEPMEESKPAAINNPKVIIDLDWLTSYMLTKGISTIQLAKDFGFSGDKVYYGTKILKNKVRIDLDRMMSFCKKHPTARSHYSIESKKVGK